MESMIPCPGTMGMVPGHVYRIICLGSEFPELDLSIMMAGKSIIS